MKFMIEWSIPPDTNRAAFLSTGAPPPDGQTILGRWHASLSRDWAVD